jgi:hypothetical protein
MCEQCRKVEAAMAEQRQKTRDAVIVRVTVLGQELTLAGVLALLAIDAYYAAGAWWALLLCAAGAVAWAGGAVLTGKALVVAGRAWRRWRQLDQLVQREWRAPTPCEPDGLTEVQDAISRPTPWTSRHWS